MERSIQRGKVQTLIRLVYSISAMRIGGLNYKRHFFLKDKLCCPNKDFNVNVTLTEPLESKVNM